MRAHTFTFSLSASIAIQAHPAHIVLFAQCIGEVLYGQAVQLAMPLDEGDPCLTRICELADRTRQFIFEVVDRTVHRFGIGGTQLRLQQLNGHALLLVRDDGTRPNDHFALRTFIPGANAGILQTFLLQLLIHLVAGLFVQAAAGVREFVL